MNLDFRTKLLLTVTIGICIVEGSIMHSYPMFGTFLCFLPYLFALLSGNYSMMVKGIVITGMAFFGEKYLLSHPDNILALILTLYCGIVINILPGIMMGYYATTTTTMSDLVCSLQMMRLPDAIIIPISVMFRFFYSIKEDYQKINEAIYMHGLTLKNFFKDPLRIFEYKLVPLLMITSQTADNVAISAMTRGMRVGSSRSSISQTRLKWMDALWIGFCLFVLGLFVKVKVC